MADYGLGDLGNEIVGSIDEALAKGDFSGLSSSVQQSVSTYARSVTRDINKAMTDAMAASSQQTEEQKRAAQKRKRFQDLYVTTTPKGFSSFMKVLFGGLFTFTFGITSISQFFTFLFSLGTRYAISDELPVLITVLAFTVISSMVLYSGVSRRKMNKRFKQYVQTIGDRDYCSVKELANVVDKDEQFVVKEITKMLSEKYFRQGHFDHDFTTLMVTNAAYEDYIANEKQRLAYEREQREEAAKNEANRADSESKYSPEVLDLLDEGEAYIKLFHECNEAIPGEAMTKKLARLEEIMARIFNQVKQDPSSASDLRKFMNYYLPTTAKLINAYKDMDQQPSLGSENIENSKREIEETLDTINEAFVNILDDMYEDTQWDISSDISTMKRMMEQDGLTGTEGNSKQDEPQQMATPSV